MFKFIGVTDDTTTCDCCGKTNLKRTVVLKSNEGDIVYYGVNCAAKAMRQTGGKETARDVNAHADVIAYAQRLIAKNIYTGEQICQGIANRFGYPSQVRNGFLRIATFAELEMI